MPQLNSWRSFLMKSPFADKTTHRYVYPAPLDAEQKRSGSVFNGRFIDPEVTDSIEKDGEEAPWIRLRLPLSKRLRDGLAEAGQMVLQAGGEGLVQATPLAEANRRAFTLLIDSWSFGEEPTGEQFGDLDLWASNWIQACIVDAQIKAEPDFPAPAKPEAAGGTDGSSETTSDEDDSSSPPADGPSVRLAESVSG
jgi:hypothetical protein